MQKTQLLMFTAFVLLLGQCTARADLLFTLNPSVRTGTQGSTVTFSGTLQNTGSSEVFLNGDNFTLAGVGLTLDDTKFFTNAPLSLLGGASWSGEIFDVMVGASAAQGTFSGSFSILGGGDDLALDLLATQNFEVIVEGAAPFHMMLGPTPYLSFDDSPFKSMDFSSDYFFLEDFEDGLLNTPGLSVSNGVVIGPSTFTDSVDADDGIIDGSGANGHSLFHIPGAIGFVFHFSPTSLSSLPTHAGVVWTDGATSNDITFEAFDALNNSLGTLTLNNWGDDNFAAGTAEDRFFGIIHSGGIGSMKITSVPVPGSSGVGIEVDHVQYGRSSLVVVPEPSIPMTLSLGLLAISLFIKCRAKWV